MYHLYHRRWVRKRWVISTFLYTRIKTLSVATPHPTSDVTRKLYLVSCGGYTTVVKAFASFIYTAGKPVISNRSAGCGACNYCTLTFNHRFIGTCIRNGFCGYQYGCRLWQTPGRIVGYGKRYTVLSAAMQIGMDVLLRKARLRVTMHRCCAAAI